MRSVPSPDDLTTRARIREASIALFGEGGFAHTSVRAIAERAGVSPGLVMHHFGSKAALRIECDEYLVETFVSRKSDVAGPGAAQTIREWLGDIDQFRPFVDYLSRMLLDGTEGGDRLFDLFVAETRVMIDRGIADGSMNDSSDRDMLSTIVALYGVAPLVMRRQLGRSLGSDVLDASALRRMTLPILELYTNGLYADDAMLVATREALAATDPGARSRPGEYDDTVTDSTKGAGR
ncbi:TetR/AcrR family transcriptional regulator [Marisediminicola senii]|uniref:TetR/AcrR family transcriptional regulator n=1 Tax=Marisediminicola senii TaxID=2711233 RepID=UPI0013EB43B0|nr:TetR family transcriptional regulator [Marisediminicola senii]